MIKNWVFFSHLILFFDIKNSTLDDSTLDDFRHSLIRHSLIFDIADSALADSAFADSTFADSTFANCITELILHWCCPRQCQSCQRQHDFSGI
jgi:hypothetical protein